MKTDGEIQGRVEAATRIFDEFGDFIFHCICTNITDHSHAEDLMQQFFLALVDHPIPADIDDLMGYLYRAIYNDIIDHSRRVKRYELKCFKYKQHLEADVQEVESPEDIVTRAQEVEHMFRLIEKELPRREYQAVEERFRQGRTVSEAAGRLGVNKRSFSRYLCMGMKKVRCLFGTDDEDGNV